MKRVLVIILFVLLGKLSIAQQFNLTSTSFSVGSIYKANPRILFDLAKSTISKESYPLLDSIAEFLLKNDKLVIEVGVHNDSRVAEQEKIRSRNLSQSRAQNIVDYLIDKGIPKEQLIPVGFGATQLIISEKEIDNLKTAQEKEEAHAVNRRTEFKILEIRK